MINDVRLLVTVYNAQGGLEYRVHSHDALLEDIITSLINSSDRVKTINEGIILLLNSLKFKIVKQITEYEGEKLLEIDIINTTIIDLLLIKDMLLKVEDPQIDMLFEKIKE